MPTSVPLLLLLLLLTLLLMPMSVPLLLLLLCDSARPTLVQLHARKL